MTVERTQFRRMLTLSFGLLGFVALALQSFTGVSLYFHLSLLAFAQCGALLVLEEIRHFAVWLQSDKNDPFRRRLDRLKTLVVLPLAAVFIGALTFFFFTVEPTPLRADQTWIESAVALFAALVLFGLTQTWKLADKSCDDKELITDFLRFDTLVFALIGIELSFMTWTGFSFTRPIHIGLCLLWTWFALQFFAALFSFTASMSRGASLTLRLKLNPLKAFQSIEGLKKHTGLSTHSLWSIKFLRKGLPITIAAICFITWYSTSFLQVNPGWQAAVYRLGKLTPDHILGPGLHLLWPIPFDKKVLVPTDAIRSSALGYKPDESRDFLWSQSHSEEEYKLPIGGGTELISANLRINWHVGNLYEFLTTFTDPESHLTAQGYHLLLSRTEGNTLDKLLTEDRHNLTQELTAALQEWAEKSHSGILVDGVLVESLHPPVEIAESYQNVISATRAKSTLTAQAEGESAALKALAQADQSNELSLARSKQLSDKGDALAEAVKFKAAAQAAKEKDYKFTKLMKTLERTLPGRKLYILGSEVDPSSMVFTNGLSLGLPQTTEHPPTEMSVLPEMDFSGTAPTKEVTEE